MITSSLASINTRTTSGVTDKYLTCGQSVLVRKFNDSVFPSGSWNEIWIGVRWRVTTAYDWKRVNSNAVPSDFTRMMFGVCRCDGFVFGQTGSISSSTQPQHYAGFGTREQPFFGENSWSYQYTQSNNTALSQSFFKQIFSSLVMATGSLTASQDNNRPVLIPATSYPSASRNMMIIRMLTGSAPDSKRWKFQCAFPHTTQSWNDLSSSTIMADALGQSNWTQSAAFLLSKGYITSSESTNYVDRDANGYFDGVFISWPRLYDTLDISDVVVRLI